MFPCKHYCIVMCFLERSYGYMVSLLWYSPTSLRYIPRDPCNGENSHLLGVSRESYTRFSVLSFFNESVFPRSMTIPLGPIRFSTKICWYIRKLMFISSVNYTGDKREKCWRINFFQISQELSWVQLYLNIEFFLIFHFLV